MADHQDIMRDEQIGQAHFILQFIKHVDHLRLNGNVQGRDRLVADDELRVQGEGTGDADALALAAGELVGIAGGMLAVEAHAVHQLQDPLLALGLVPVHLMDVQRFADDIGDGHAGVQRGIGILEDHGGLPAEFTDIRFRADRLSLKADFAAGRFIQVQERAADRGLAAAGFPHQAKGLAAADAEGHIVHRFERL